MQGDRLFFCPYESTLVHNCFCLSPPPPPPPPPSPFVCTTCTQICANVKDPIAICCKRVDLTDSCVETRKYCAQGGGGSVCGWGGGGGDEIVPYYGCSLPPPQGKQPEFSVNCMGQESYLI